jgi:hypothetical protein
MYFESHPLITYDNKKVVDIFKKIIISNQYLDNTILFQFYDVIDGKSPENLAYKLYGSAEHHWILILINNIVNVNKDWPMSTQDFNVFVSKKYNNPYEKHHYEDSDGDIVDTMTNNPISNYTYEERINNKKSRIKILKPVYIMEFVENFKSLL